MADQEAEVPAGEAPAPEEAAGASGEEGAAPEAEAGEEGGDDGAEEGGEERASAAPTPSPASPEPPVGRKSPSPIPTKEKTEKDKVRYLTKENVKLQVRLGERGAPHTIQHKEQNTFKHHTKHTQPSCTATPHLYTHPPHLFLLVSSLL